jgi:hypothetical protein
MVTVTDVTIDRYIVIVQDDATDTVDSLIEKVTQAYRKHVETNLEDAYFAYITHKYEHVLNGFSAFLGGFAVSFIEQQPGVVLMTDQGVCASSLRGVTNCASWCALEFQVNPSKMCTEGSCRGCGGCSSGATTHAPTPAPKAAGFRNSGIEGGWAAVVCLYVALFLC